MSLYSLYSLNSGNSFSQFFADDLMILSRNARAMRSSIHEVNSKLSQIGLSLNPTKSVILCRSNYAYTHILSIPIIKNSHRYLGYYITAKGIDWATHISKKYQSLVNKTQLLRRLGIFKSGLPIEILDPILTAHLLPLIDFGLQNCPKLTKCNSRKIDVFIRKFLKSLLGSPMSFSNGLLQNAWRHPTIERRVYFFNKQEQHFAWLFGLDYPSNIVIKSPGCFKLNDFIKYNANQHPEKTP